MSIDHFCRKRYFL